MHRERCLCSSVQGIIQLLTCRLGGGERAFSHLYSMRMVNTITGDVQCLHQDTTMYQVHEKYSGNGEEWRYELRVRYTPTNLQDLYENDKVTFYYYYDQVSTLERTNSNSKTFIRFVMITSRRTSSLWI